MKPILVYMMFFLNFTQIVGYFDSCQVRTELLSCDRHCASTKAKSKVKQRRLLGCQIKEALTEVSVLNPSLLSTEISRQKDLV